MPITIQRIPLADIRRILKPEEEIGAVMRRNMPGFPADQYSLPSGTDLRLHRVFALRA